MGGGCGPNCITFTINTLLANLTDEDKESIEASITEILQGLGSGNVTFSEFREGSAIVDASPQNFVSAEAVANTVKEKENIKTLGTQRFIVAKIDEAPVEYTDKLIIVPTDDTEPILYINNGAADTVTRRDWRAQGIAPEAIKSVAFGNSVQTIGDGAFQQCTSLTEVTIPNSVQTIGDGAFRECTSLTEVTIPNSVQTIGNFAFTECTSLTEFFVDVANANYSSDDGVLFNKNKTDLIQYPIGNTRTQYTIPNSVQTIGISAFAECTSLTEVTIGNSVQTIGFSAFANCTSLTEVTIPNSVTSIGNSAFAACTSLDSVKFDNTNISTISLATFDGCPAVTEPTNFIVANLLPEISFGGFNGDFSIRGTGGDGLQFGPVDDPEPGFKTVTVVP